MSTRFFGRQTIGGRKTSFFFIFLFVTSLALVSFTRWLHSYTAPYSNDSAAYLEAARNFSAGNGFLITAQVGPAVVEPIRQWPLGFPVLLSLAMRAGVPPEYSGQFLSLSAAVLLPLLLFATFRRDLGDRAALLCSLLVASGPGVLECSYKVLTDDLFLVTAIGSVSVLLHTFGSRRPALSLLVAGLLAGFGYDLRTVGLALVLAGALALFMGFVWYRLSGRWLVLWLAGVGIGALPVLIRNIVVFGRAVPYSMPPSVRSLPDNLRDFAHACVSELSGAYSGHAFPFAAILALALLILMALGIRSLWPSWDLRLRLSCIVLSAYVVFGSAMVVAARTRYEWGEFISVRHTLQYAWALLILGALAWRAVPKRRAQSATVALTCLVVLMTVGRVRAVAREVRQTRSFESDRKSLSVGEVKLRNPDVAYWALGKEFASDSVFVAALRDIAPQSLVYSNYAAVLRIEPGRYVRNLPKGAPVLPVRQGPPLCFALFDDNSAEYLKWTRSLLQVPGVGVRWIQGRSVKLGIFQVP
jgi:hypothetical protein